MKEEFLKEATEVRTQKQAWKVINIERRRRKEINGEIKMEE